MRLTVDKWGSMTRCVNITPEIRSLISFEDVIRIEDIQKTESKIQSERDKYVASGIYSLMMKKLK